MKKVSSILVCLIILLSSCSDDEKGSRAKYLFSQYLVDEINIAEYTYDETESSFELGWVFDSSVGGKVTELGGMFPESGTYTVTLWDADTEAILAQTSVNATAGKRSMKKIDAVTIEPDKTYVVSYNTFSSRDYYWLSPEVTIYPLELDGLTVYGEVETGTGSATSEFPGIDTNNTIVGVPEIGFVKN